MNNNKQATYGVGMILGSNMLSILANLLSSWQATVFSMTAIILIILGGFKLFVILDKKAQYGLVGWFGSIIILNLFWMFFNLVIISNSFLLEKTISVMYIISWIDWIMRVGLVLFSFFLLLRSESFNRSGRKGLVVLLVSYFIGVLGTFNRVYHILPDDYNLVINPLLDFGLSIIEIIGWLYVLTNFISSEMRKLTLSIMFMMLGSTLGIFVVLGDGLGSEFASFAGYIIMLISLHKLKSYSKQQVDGKRLSIALWILVVAMMFNMLPFGEMLGTSIELVAYIIAISAYGKFKRSVLFKPESTLMTTAQMAMGLLLLATIIHALPSFGIGETIAAMLGLCIVIMMVLVWIQLPTTVNPDLLQEGEVASQDQTQAFNSPENAGVSLGAVPVDGTRPQSINCNK